MRNYRPHGHCHRQMKPIRTETTPKTRDDRVYVVREGKYVMFQVDEVIDDGDSLRCTQLNTMDKIYQRHDTINFGRVGVFRALGKTTMKETLTTAEVAGKVFSYKGLVMSVSRNVLTEV